MTSASRRAKSVAPSLLVDWCTWHPVGHAVEGLRVAGAYAAADPSLAVSVALNAATAIDLAECCPWLASVHAVPLDMVAADLTADAYAGVPRDWDWVRQDDRRRDPALVAAWPQLGRLADRAAAHLRPRHAGLPDHVAGHPLRLELPVDARTRAADLLAGRSGPVVTVLPTGSGARAAYPSLASWRLILRALTAEWPHATVVLVGKTARDGRTTSAMDRVEAEHLIADCGAIDGYDLPLLVQLAVVERSDLFLSPHSGLGFAALAVATPWLTLSGGPYFEYFHNGVPFHSLLPDTRRFPAFDGVAHHLADQDGSGPREASMTRDRIVRTLPDLVAAAAALIARTRTYDDCLADYFPRLLHALGGDRDRVTSWENIHHRYLDADG